MKTVCNQTSFAFQDLDRRKVVADFSGGNLTVDAGALLLREVDKHRGWIGKLAECFSDGRDPLLIEHQLEELLRQFVYGLAMGYEDCNDHDELRHDPMWGVLCGKHEPDGRDRRCEQDRGKATAGKSTLNRIHLSTSVNDRYKKIVCDPAAVDRLFVEQFISRRDEAPDQIILDLDATDAPLHGKQEDRFFHGYYDHYCYLPLYIFCGDELLLARLRPANIDAAAGSLEEVQRIVGQLREAWPEVEIRLRGDGGFARDDLMDWCENNGVDYVFGLPKNRRLRRLLAPAERAVKAWHEVTGVAARTFMDFTYRTINSWSASRRVVGKAEWLDKGFNPRFVVTSLSADEIGARDLYEVEYCGRGDMENRIKEQQLDLYASRNSSGSFDANQLRLYFSSIAYCLMEDLRALGLKDTQAERYQCGTIRNRLLKLAAIVQISVRRVWIRFSETYSKRSLFDEVYSNLRALEPSTG